MALNGKTDISPLVLGEFGVTTLNGKFGGDNELSGESSNSIVLTGNGDRSIIDPWLLADSEWNDSGLWIDNATWID